MSNQDQSGTPQAPPIVVLLSDRGVADDDRLRNWAATLAASGARVTVVGVSPSNARSVTAEGSVRLLEVPVRFDLRKSMAALRAATAPASAPPAAAPTAAGPPSASGAKPADNAGWPQPSLRTGLIMARTLQRLSERVAATTAARLVLAGERAGQGRPEIVGALGLRLVAGGVGLLRAGTTATRTLDRAGVALLEWREGRDPARRGRLRSLLGRDRRRSREPGWRRTWPEVADLEIALGPVLDGLNADVVCAHGFKALPLAEAAALRGRAQGRDVEWLYDARADVRVLPGRTPGERSAADRLEREALRGARRVLAATDRVAGALAAAHGLRGRGPIVVGDAPSLRPAVAQPGADLRRTIGLLDGVPLLVAAEPAAAGQGLDTLVGALALLPGVHCAVFAPREKSPVLGELRAAARRLGCADRLHFVPPVPGRERPAYLRGATVGLALDPEAALPPAYLHAGLPVVCAATGPAAEVMTELGVGEPVAPGDVDALAAAIGTVLGRREDYADLRGRPELRRFSWESEERAGALVTAFREVLGDRLSAGGRPALPAEVAGHLLPASLPVSAHVRTFAIGPRNGNGQPWEWSKAMAAAYPSIRTEVFGVQYPTGRLDMVFPCHRSIPLADWRSLDWQLAWARHLLTDVSHLLIEQGLTACGMLNGRNFFADLPMLRAHDVTVGLVFRGSELRNPSHHAAREPYSPFADPTDDRVALLQRQVDELRPHIDAFEGQVFVTTLDLKDDLPDAAWLPHVLDVDLWAGGTPVLKGPVPVVVHAPSREAMKGSALIDAVCEPLAAAGRIDYRRLRGIPYQQMPETLRAADVVIDQFALGAYGVLASQALAAGRLVVGHVSDRVRSRLPVELPIVEAEPDTLADVLLSFLDDPDAANEQAGRGEAYVRRFHSGRYSVGQLAGFLGIEDRSGWPVLERKGRAR